MAEFMKKELGEDDILKQLNLDVSIRGSGTEERPCPVCEKGKLHYDHLLNLVCPACGYVEANSFNC